MSGFNEWWEASQSKVMAAQGARAKCRQAYDAGREEGWGDGPAPVPEKLGADAFAYWKENCEMCRTSAADMLCPRHCMNNYDGRFRCHPRCTPVPIPAPTVGCGCPEAGGAPSACGSLRGMSAGWECGCPCHTPAEDPEPCPDCEWVSAATEQGPLCDVHDSMRVSYRYWRAACIDCSGWPEGTLCARHCSACIHNDEVDADECHHGPCSPIRVPDEEPDGIGVRHWYRLATKDPDPTPEGETCHHQRVRCPDDEPLRGECLDCGATLSGEDLADALQFALDGAADRSPEGETVGVRIAVVVQPDGRWEAEGSSRRPGDFLGLGRGPDSCLSWVTARVPKPTPPVDVQGEVEVGDA